MEFFKPQEFRQHKDSERLNEILQQGVILNRYSTIPVINIKFTTTKQLLFCPSYYERRSFQRNKTQPQHLQCTEYLKSKLIQCSQLIPQHYIYNWKEAGVYDAIEFAFEVVPSSSKNSYSQTQPLVMLKGHFFTLCDINGFTFNRSQYVNIRESTFRQY